MPKILSNALRAYENGSYGGWGGRKQSESGSQNAQPSFAALEEAGHESAGSPQAGAPGLVQPDFFPAVQRDFAARLKWSVTQRFPDANHEPKVRIKGPLNASAH